MNRRNFLKSIGAIGGVLALPALTLPTIAEAKEIVAPTSDLYEQNARRIFINLPCYNFGESSSPSEGLKKIRAHIFDKIDRSYLKVLTAQMSPCSMVDGACSSKIKAYPIEVRTRNIELTCDFIADRCASLGLSEEEAIGEVVAMDLNDRLRGVYGGEKHLMLSLYTFTECSFFASFSLEEKIGAMQVVKVDMTRVFKFRYGLIDTRKYDQS